MATLSASNVTRHFDFGMGIREDLARVSQVATTTTGRWVLALRSLRCLYSISQATRLLDAIAHDLNKFAVKTARGGTALGDKERQQLLEVGRRCQKFANTLSEHHDQLERKLTPHHGLVVARLAPALESLCERSEDVAETAALAASEPFTTIAVNDIANHYGQTVR